MLELHILLLLASCPNVLGEKAPAPNREWRDPATGSLYRTCNATYGCSKIDEVKVEPCTFQTLKNNESFFKNFVLQIDC